MVWQADHAERRTYDEERSSELIALSSGSDDATRFKILCEDGEFEFTAALDWEELSEGEKRELGVMSASIWLVLAGASEERRKTIAEALLAFKSGHGFVVRDERYFVRFSRRGALIDD